MDISSVPKHIGSTVWPLKVSHPKETMDAKFFSAWDLLATNLLQNKWHVGNLTECARSPSARQPEQYHGSLQVAFIIIVTIRMRLFTLLCSLFVHIWHFLIVWHQVSTEPKKSQAALKSWLNVLQGCKAIRAVLHVVNMERMTMKNGSLCPNSILRLLSCLLLRTFHLLLGLSFYWTGWKWTGEMVCDELLVCLNEIFLWGALNLISMLWVY